MRKRFGTAGGVLTRSALATLLLFAAVHREAVADQSVEAEQLLQEGKASASGGELHVQPMAEFGPDWSGGAQLFWTAPAPGAVLDLKFQLPAKSRWQLWLEMTVAPDYGKVEFEVDGEPIGHRVEVPPPPPGEKMEERRFKQATLPRIWDGYGKTVGKSAADILGTLRLPNALGEGEHRLSIKVIGKDERSTGYFVGIDRLVFHRLPSSPTVR